MNTYAFFFLERTNPDTSVDSRVSGLVELEDADRFKLADIVETMEMHHMVEGFTMVPIGGQHQGAKSAAGLAELLCDVALEGYTVANMVENAEWWELGESLAAYCPKLFDYVREDLGNVKPSFSWEKK